MQVAIIGAGISGLYLALNISKLGHKVTIFEKRDKIGQEACSGLFSEKIFDFFPESKCLIKNKIDHTVINFPKKTIKVNFKKPFFVISHAELDRMAGDLAKKFGVKIILNKEIKEIPQGFDRIIGADGPLSLVRKSLGLKNPTYRLGILGLTKSTESTEARPLQIYRGPSSVDYVETWPLKKGGFIWKIPRGENIEYGVMAPQNIAKKEFDKFLKDKNIFLQDIKAKLIPQKFFLPKNKHIALAGDAAGLTKPWSGGGVIWQLTLADILIDTFPNFLNYRKKANKFFVSEIFFSKIMVIIVYFLGFNCPWLLPNNKKIKSDFLFSYKKND